MRIVSGKYGGRIIQTPKGKDTRPTTDRVRESIMSSVESRVGGFDGKTVIDAFAGSGALGIESLSRGASFVHFTDKSPEAVSIIKSNIDDLKIPTTKFIVDRCDVYKSGIRCQKENADIVFFDPPYATDAQEVIRLITDSRQRGILNKDCVIVYEHDMDNDEATSNAIEDAGFIHLGRKKYGKTKVDYIGLS